MPSQNATMAAPTPGAARMIPRPTGPTWRILSAYAGNSATTPPNSTAKRSSEIAPSTGFFCQTNTNPPRTSRQCHSAVDLASTGFTPSIMNIAPINSATAMPYDQSMPKISVRPAMAGPLMVAMVNISVFMEIAPDSSSFGTRFGTIA